MTMLPRWQRMLGWASAAGVLVVGGVVAHRFSDHAIPMRALATAHAPIPGVVESVPFAQGCLIVSEVSVGQGAGFNCSPGDIAVWRVSHRTIALISRTSPISSAIWRKRGAAPTVRLVGSCIVSIIQPYSPRGPSVTSRTIPTFKWPDFQFLGAGSVYDRGTYEEHVELSQCMSYTVKLVPA